ncbi:hypothetical protein [Nocardiopsis synnemataformans]|uniref:hypothetical protein n=1 Tax=Nocardiopsis synnemataformans TaxID=61305 RepID=UPI003EB9B093
MTEIAIRQPDALPAKIEYAKQLAYADMLPRQYQDKPANLLFAIEYAEMLGLSPMAAITGVHVIEGKPSASANLISGLVRRAGHRLRVRVDRSQSGPVAIAQIIRSDDPEFTFESRWDMARARQAGVAGKHVWKAYPEAMLKARAITEVAREACEEALSGLSYTPEELGANVNADGTVVSAVPVARVQAQPGASVREAAQQAQPAAPEPAPASVDEAAPEQSPRMITQPQTRKLGALMRECGISGRDAALAYVSEVIGRQVGSRNELTVDEAGRVIDALEQQHTAAQEAAAAPASEPVDDGVADAEVVEETPADVWRDLVDGSPLGWSREALEAEFAKAHGGRHPSSGSVDELSTWGARVLSGAVKPPKRAAKASAPAPAADTGDAVPF